MLEEHNYSGRKIFARFHSEIYFFIGSLIASQYKDLNNRSSLSFQNVQWMQSKIGISSISSKNVRPCTLDIGTKKRWNDYCSWFVLNKWKPKKFLLHSANNYPANIYIWRKWPKQGEIYHPNCFLLFSSSDKQPSLFTFLSLSCLDWSLILLTTRFEFFSPCGQPAR